MNCSRYRVGLCFVGAIAAWAMSASAQEPTWYRSNADFMLLEQIPEHAEYRFTVSRDENGERVVLTLYDEGEAIGTREITNRDGVVSEVRERDGEGEERFVETYRYRPDKTLRSVTRCDQSGECLSIRYSAAAEEELEDGSVILERSYDSDLRAVQIVRSADGEVVESETRTYDSSGLAESVLKRGTRAESTTWEAGRRVARTVTDDGRFLESERYWYDQDGRVTRTQTSTRREVIEEESSYGDDGSSVTRRYVDDDLVRETSVQADGSSQELRYRDGNLLLKIFYKNDVRVREDLYENGVVVESRTFDEEGRE